MGAENVLSIAILTVLVARAINIAHGGGTTAAKPVARRRLRSVADSETTVDALSALLARRPAMHVEAAALIAGLVFAGEE